MRPRSFLLLTFSLFGAALTAQSDCFLHFFNQGEKALNSTEIEKWSEAELYFTAAFHCLENDEAQKSLAQKMKERAKQKYIDAILAARDSVGQANLEIERQARISTALSWSFFAQEEVAKDSFFTALALAFRAYETVKEYPNPFSPLVQKSFGNTIYASDNISLTGHDDSILEAMITPDGSSALTRSRDSTVRLWDIQTGAIIAILGPHHGFVHAMAYAPDGSRIATVAADGLARLWSREGTLLREMKGHTDEVLAVAFANDGRILTGSRDGIARLWDPEGNLIKTLEGHTGPVLVVSFARQGGKMLSATARQVKIWSSDGSPFSTLDGHHSYLYAARFSPNGEKVLTASADSTAIIWNITGEKSAILNGHSGIVHNAWFSKNGQRVLTISTDGSARLWQASGGLLAELPGHEGLITSAAFSPNGSKVVVVSKSKTPILWDIQNPDKVSAISLTGHSDEVLQAAFSPNGDKLLTASRDRSAKLWDLEGNVILNIDGFGGPVLSTAFSPDGRHLLAASADNTAILCEEPEAVFQRLQQAPPRLTEEQKRRFELR